MLRKLRLRLVAGLVAGVTSAEAGKFSYELALHWLNKECLRCDWFRLVASASRSVIIFQTVQSVSFAISLLLMCCFQSAAFFKIVF